MHSCRGLVFLILFIFSFLLKSILFTLLRKKIFFFFDKLIFWFSYKKTRSHIRISFIPLYDDFISRDMCFLIQNFNIHKS